MRIKELHRLTEILETAGFVKVEDGECEGKIFYQDLRRYILAFIAHEDGLVTNTRIYAFVAYDKGLDNVDRQNLFADYRSLQGGALVRFTIELGRQGMLAKINEVSPFFLPWTKEAIAELGCKCVPEFLLRS